MRQLNPYTLIDIDDYSDLQKNIKNLQSECQDWQARLNNLACDQDHKQERGEILLELGDRLVDLEQGAQAWKYAHEAFNLFIIMQKWQEAVHACDIMFRADQPNSLAALGHGIWLGVTYPISLSWTTAILQHLIEETPPESNVPPIAAITAHYIARMRANDAEDEQIIEYTQQLITMVAGRHRGVQTQGEFEAWLIGNELDDPEKFLPRLAEAINNLTQGNWWIDRDLLRRNLPINGNRS